MNSQTAENEILAFIKKCTPDAQAIINQATQLGISRRNPMVDRYHLAKVLATSPSGSDSAFIIQEWGLNTERLISQADRQLNLLELASDPRNTRIVFSPGINEVLENAKHLAEAYGSNKIRSAFILLAFLIQTYSMKEHRIFSELCKIDPKTLAEELLNLCKETPEATRALATPPSQPSSQQSSTESDTLSRFTIDLTARARNGQIDQVIGRERELCQITDILLRRGQNNPILTGEAGVGKTAVVEGLALKIASGQVPAPLKKVALKSLDLGLLQAGASAKGEIESRLHKILEEVKSSPTPIILFIDEAHTMIGAGGLPGQGDIANLLKPALARGELRTIAATTWAEYKKYFEKDAALVRRFQVVKIEEPSEETTIQMVRGIVPKLERHHGVIILEEAVLAATQLSTRYINDRRQPDIAFRVLDTACTRVALSQSSQPPRWEVLQAEIEGLRAKQNRIRREIACGHRNNSEDLENLQDELTSKEADLASLENQLSGEKILINELIGLQKELAEELDQNLATPARNTARNRAKIERVKNELKQLQGDSPLLFPWVDSQTVASVIENWTGIPVTSLKSNEIENLLNLHKKLSDRVIGQDHAIEQIVDRIMVHRTGLTNPDQPVGIFLLAGPSGVGKTQTALSLAEALYGRKDQLITINMSEFQEAHTVSLLKGSPPGYVGYGEGGVLTESVRRKPWSVVLIDEVEKAHPDVIELFYQVFDKGRLEDGSGVVVNFKNCLFVLTTNAGDQIIQNAFHPVEEKESDALQPETQKSDSTDEMNQADNSGTVGGDPGDSVDLEELNSDLYSYLAKIFKPAFIGRLTVVPYRPISESMLVSIIHLQLNDLKQQVWEEHKIEVTYDESVIATIAERCLETRSGARNVSKIISNAILPTCSKIILESLYSEKPINEIVIRTDESGYFEFEQNDEPVLSPSGSSQSNLIWS